MTITYMTEESIELADMALRVDGVMPWVVGETPFNVAKFGLAVIVGELSLHIRNPQVFVITDEKETLYRVYSGDLQLAEAPSARKALEQAHSDFTPCAALG